MTTLMKGLRRTGATTKMIDALFVQYHRVERKVKDMKAAGYKGQFLVLCYGAGAKKHIEEKIQERSWGNGSPAGSINPFLNIRVHDLANTSHNMMGMRIRAENIFEDNSLDDMPFSMLDSSLMTLNTMMERDMTGLPTDADNSPITNYNYKPYPPPPPKVPQEEQTATTRNNNIETLIKDDPYRPVSLSLEDKYSQETIESLKGMIERGYRPFPLSPEANLLDDLEFNSKYPMNRDRTFDSPVYDKWGNNSLSHYINRTTPT